MLASPRLLMTWPPPFMGFNTHVLPLYMDPYEQFKLQQFVEHTDTC